MKSTIVSFLQTNKKESISLGELERLVGGPTMRSLPSITNELIQHGILVVVKQYGNNHKPILLALTYRIILLAQAPAKDKENKICNGDALIHFLSFFLPQEQHQIREILGNGGYYAIEIKKF